MKTTGQHTAFPRLSRSFRKNLANFVVIRHETLRIGDVNASAVAVDPETGNVWVLVSNGSIGSGKTVVYNEKGTVVATYNISGWDIVYDRTSKAFWIAEKALTKIIAATGEVAFSDELSTWCASSIDVDQNSGAVWVAVRKHPQVAGSVNQLIALDAECTSMLEVDLKESVPIRVSVDPKNGTVWVANMKKSVQQFSADGLSQAEHLVEALAVQVDPAGNDVWVVTPTEIQKMTPKGDVKHQAKHAGKTSQAWIGLLE